MPRVFHLIKSLGRGGAEMLLTEGLRYAHRNDFEYGYGYFIPWKDSVVPSLRAQGADVVCFNCQSGASMLLSVRRVSAFLQKWEADVVHCHLPLAGIVGRLAGRMSGVPVIYTEHNKMERYHPLTRYANLLTWSLQARVVAVSEEVEKSIRRHTRSITPVDVVLNGVDTDRFDRGAVDAREMRRNLGIPPTARIVGTVAVFRRQKRLDDWLSAARLLLDRHPDLHFLIVGDGPLRDDLLALRDSLGLGNVVHFPGLEEDVRPYLSMMDVFMSSSEFEGLPLALLEAMSMECVVVATEVGGVPEVVKDGVNGFLIEPGQPLALADGVSGVLSSLQRLQDLRSVARKTIEENFGILGMMRRLEEIYLATSENGCRGR